LIIIHESILRVCGLRPGTQGYWGNCMLLLGGGLWMASPITCNFFVTDNVCLWIDLAASVALVFCAMLHLMQYLQFRRFFGVAFMPVYACGLGDDGLLGWLSQCNWYTAIYGLFLLGSFAQFFASCFHNFPSVFPNTTQVFPWLYFAAAHVWLLSAVCGITMGYLDRRSRNYYSAKIQWRIMPCMSRDRESPDYYVFFHFSGCAEIFRIIGTVVYVGSMWYFVIQNYYPMYIFSVKIAVGVFFTISSVANFLHYFKLEKYMAVLVEDQVDSLKYKSGWEAMSENNKLLGGEHVEAMIGRYEDDDA